MRIEEDEQIGGAVAFVLAIVALKSTRPPAPKSITNSCCVIGLNPRPSVAGDEFLIVTFRNSVPSAAKTNSWAGAEPVGSNVDT
jgi:hypothetical protein